MRQAKDVDKELKRDRFRGPLQGIPYGAKDLLSLRRTAHHLGRQALRRTGLRLQRHRARQSSTRPARC